MSDGPIASNADGADAIDVPDPLDDLLADHITRTHGTPEGAAATRRLLAGLRAALDAGAAARVAAVIRRAATPELDYSTATALLRLKKRCGPDAAAGRTVRLAVLGSSTQDQLTQLIDLFLFAAGFTADIYQAEYGVFRQEILDPASRLHDFRPSIVLIATTFRDIARRPAVTDDREQVAATLAAETAEWAHLWQTVHDRLGCAVVQNNFDAPPWRHLGNHEMRHPAGFARFVAALNLEFVTHAPPYVTIHDLDALAAAAGRWTWGDDRFFLQAKIPCAPELLVDYAHSLASLITASLGASKKCLVLDLDNTLWGGVVGDDGLGGLRLGQGDAEGEAFLAWQRYVRALRDRGVLLAVCSKNTDRIAREVFERHTEMVLRLPDISTFVANWDDKARNIRTIARDLNIGLDSLVFVDDNPAERALVRRFLPEVAVPEVGTDPLDFIRVLEQHRYFQLTSLGREDFQRTEYYRANDARKEAASATGGVDEFLRAAAMRSVVGPIVADTLARAAQLINKSNQWNLTTRRRTAAEVLALTADPAWLTRTFTLTDRFGDNGLICVVLARVAGAALEIDTWLMSCRVLKRGVEALVLNHLCGLANRHGLEFVRGEFLPTAKNDLVRDHYRDMGFRRTAGDDTGGSAWELELVDFQPRPHFIEEIEAQHAHQPA